MICFVPSLLYQDNRTPLFVASWKGHHDVVQSLLGAGAEVNIARSGVSDVMCGLGYMYMYIVVRTEGKHNLGYGCVCVVGLCKL